MVVLDGEDQGVDQGEDQREDQGDDRVLVRRRPSRGLWGGLWELPWLEKNGADTAEETLARLLVDLRGSAAKGEPAHSEKLGLVRHGLTHLELELVCFRVEVRGNGVPQGPLRRGREPRRWVTRHELSVLPLARLSHKAILLWREGKDGAEVRPEPRRAAGDRRPEQKAGK